jgi:tetratricopeptide (TPR) repeat protein/DNA-binding transcriptional regulator YiaG
VSKLVDLTGHAKYKPDVLGLACGKITATRTRLGLSHGDFADALSRLLNWEVSAGLIRSWECMTAPPPGDVLAACDVLVNNGCPEEKTSHPPTEFMDSGRTTADIDFGGVRVPCRSADGRIVWVTVPRRTFLLGGVSATAALAMRPVTRSVSQIATTSDISPIEHLQRMRQMLIESDNLLGPGHIIPTVHEHIQIIRQLRAGRSGADGRALLYLQAQFAEFAGWLHQDSGDFQQAQFWLDRALDWSHAVADREMSVYILARKSQLAGDMRDFRNAIDLADAAIAMTHSGSRLHATAETYKAYGYALADEPKQALCGLDQASNLAAVPEDGPWAVWLDEAYVNVQRGRCLAAVGSHDQAAEVFQTAIRNLPPSFRRDRGVYLAREAQAYAGAGVPEQAAAAGSEALGIAEETGSGRIVNELAELDTLIARWSQVPAVADFRDALTSIIPQETEAL